MGSYHPVQVIAVTGGKGGVGKTSVSINLSVALAQMGRRVALLDADLGLANIDVLLGLSAKHNLENVLAGTHDLKEVMLTGPGGIRIIPASSGTQRMAQLGAAEHAGLIHAFSELAEQIDVLIIDTAAGITDSVVSFVRAANEVLVVVCDEPSSITDAYALIKLLNRDYGLTRFRVLASMTRSPQEGQSLFNKLLQVSERFLDATLQFADGVFQGLAVLFADQRGDPVLVGFQQLLEAEHDLGALGRRGVAPDREGGFGSINRSLDSCPVSQFNLANCFAEGGVVYRCGASAVLNCLAVDEVGDSAHEISL